MQVLVVCSDEELLKKLIDANKLLDMVQKGLSDYLETKRLAFPRFYFLSNEELLEILSETKDPLRVQPFCKKIFEGINSLEFQKSLDVTAMFSEESERVEFNRSFNPKDAGKCGKSPFQIKNYLSNIFILDLVSFLLYRSLMSRFSEEKGTRERADSYYYLLYS